MASAGVSMAVDGCQGVSKGGGCQRGGVSQGSQGVSKGGVSKAVQGVSKGGSVNVTGGVQGGPGVSRGVNGCQRASYTNHCRALSSSKSKTR